SDGATFTVKSNTENNWSRFSPHRRPSQLQAMRFVTLKLWTARSCCLKMSRGCSFVNRELNRRCASIRKRPRRQKRKLSSTKASGSRGSKMPELPEVELVVRVVDRLV